MLSRSFRLRRAAWASAFGGLGVLVASHAGASDPPPLAARSSSAWTSTGASTARDRVWTAASVNTWTRNHEVVNTEQAETLVIGLRFSYSLREALAGCQREGC